MPNFILSFCDFFRAPKADHLPIKQKFWLYFFFFTTIILAFASGYFVVKLEKIQESCHCDLESKSL